MEGAGCWSGLVFQMRHAPLDCAWRLPHELWGHLRTEYRATVYARPHWQTVAEGEQTADAELSEKLAGSLADRWPAEEKWEEWSIARAGVCRTIASFRRHPSKVSEALRDYASGYGVEIRGELDAAVRARSHDPSWWERAGWRAYVRDSEALARKLGLVGKGRALYVSEPTLRQFRERNARCERILDSLVAVNEEGLAIPLSDARDASVSNPTVRRAELMTRLKGSEEYANRHGLPGTFFTLTAPSKLHRASRKWNGADPPAVQRYFCKLWARVRAAVKRRGIAYFGIRIAEPHKDGTPHWHLLLWCDPAKQDELESIFKDYALREDGAEPGADKRRLKCERMRTDIDPDTGKPFSAVGYVAKYIAKNVDGHSVGEHKALNRSGEMEPTGVPVNEAVERVLAWARVWGIRQFQFFGAPKVTVWRELRRLTAETKSQSIEPGRRAADEGDWCAFMQATDETRIELKKEQTGEVNRYGELKADAVIGVRAGTDWIKTRHHTWRVLPSWTCDNNCTHTFDPPPMLARNGLKPIRLVEQQPRPPVQQRT